MIQIDVLKQTDNSYTISFGTSTECGVVVVERDINNLKLLNESLLLSYFMVNEEPPKFTIKTIPNCQELQDYLMYWFEFFNDIDAISDALVSFMEESCGHKDVSRLLCSAMRKKIVSLSRQNKEYEAALKEANNKTTQLTEMVTQLQTRIGSFSCSEDDRSFRNSSTSEVGSSNSAVEVTTPFSPINSEYNLLSKISGTENGNLPRLRIQSASDLSIPEATTVEDEGSPRASGSVVASADLQQTAQLLRELCPDAEQVHVFDEGVQETLLAIQPHPSQVAFRASVVALVKRQVRQTMRVNSFESGLHELRCFLPDDPTKLTVVLGKHRTAEWNKTVRDRLIALSMQPELSTASSVSHADEEYSADIEDEFPIYDHVVKKVSRENDSTKVDCHVDLNEVSITCNRKGDIGMVVFLEEVAALVGQDDLFKRSLLLIRAWWFYETAAYFGTSIRHYLNDFSMCVMVCAIFNQHHTRIQSPLQTLCLFLAEYSTYDGTTEVITLQGIVPFVYSDSSVFNVPDVTEQHLFNLTILEKYWAIFNMPESKNSSYAQTQMVDELVIDLTRATFFARGHQHSGLGFYSSYTGNSAQRAYGQQTSRFDRLGFNIAHPFLNANMTERLSGRRAQRVQRAFAAGAQQFLAILQKSPGESPAGVSQSMRGFYAQVTTRYGNGFIRPDRIPEKSPQFRTNPELTDPRLLEVQLDRLVHHILYCNFVLESVVSDTALLMLCTEILKEKKIQPVGEVGKMLAEVTSTPNLSQKLKEKFGGLKKFLEHYSGRFVFSTDHPFNPCVTLHNILTGMRLEPSDAGVQALAAYIKSKKNGSKRNTPFTSPDVSHLGGQTRDMTTTSPYYSSSSGSSSARSSMGAVNMSPPMGNSNMAMVPASTATSMRPDVGAAYARFGQSAYGAQSNIPDTALWQPVAKVPEAFSMRMSVKQAMASQSARPYGVQGNGFPQQQQQQLQSRPMPARPQQQQYVSMSVPSSAYPRQVSRQYQNSPGSTSPPPPGDLRGQYGGNGGNDSATAMTAYSMRSGTTQPPLYARAGLHSSSSPQQQYREMDARFSSTSTPVHTMSTSNSVSTASVMSSAPADSLSRSSLAGLGIGETTGSYGGGYHPSSSFPDMGADLRLVDYAQVEPSSLSRPLSQSSQQGLNMTSGSTNSAGTANGGRSLPPGLLGSAADGTDHWF